MAKQPSAAAGNSTGGNGVRVSQKNTCRTRYDAKNKNTRDVARSA
jgi:hypothetical protein